MNGYLRLEDGSKLYFEEIAIRVQREAPETRGKHISVQLEALGLTEAMRRGSTPCALPYTFTD